MTELPRRSILEENVEKENVQYALSGLAVDFATIGDFAAATGMVQLSINPWFTEKLAEYLKESLDDETVKALIEKRRKPEVWLV
jgi:hypothetical protein